MPALLRPPADLVPFGLGAMKSVALASGELRPGARRLLDAAQRLLLGTRLDLDALAPVSPEELAGELVAPVELRRQLVHGMCVLTLADGPPDPRATALVARFARAVGIDEPAVRTLQRFAEGHRVLGALDWLRRSHFRAMIGEEVERGVVGAAKALLGLRGFVEDPAVAAPYLGLGDLPAGTLGRALFDHYRGHGFALPGERGGFPEAGVYHDVAHVLGGYDTDPLGELQVGGFIAGFRARDPFYVAMLPLLVFVAGIDVTPLDHDAAAPLFARPGVAEAYLDAIDRGGRVRVDLSDHWDFWPLVRLPLDEARARLGVPPPRSAAATAGAALARSG